MANKDLWNPIPLTPLTGILDTRSRPAELTPGSFRAIINLAINRTGALCVRPGHAALDFGLRSDSPSAVANWDFHRRGLTRDPVTFMFESTSPAGVRQLFAGTQSTLDFLHNDTSEWTNLASGGSGAIWKAAAMEDQIIFTSGLGGGIVSYTLGDNGFNGQPLEFDSGSFINAAKIAVAFGDVVLLLNVKEANRHLPSRIWWSDFRKGYYFKTPPTIVGADPIADASIAGFQDLDYGDDIQAAALADGALYVFTTRSIWRVTLNTSTQPDDSPFTFTRFYSEPKNQTACIAYPNSLVTDGKQLFWLGRDAVWTYNRYIAAPECPDWLLKGSGILYDPNNADRMEQRCCEAVIGEYHPDTREVWFCYPQATNPSSAVCINNRSLVLNVEYRTMGTVDIGYTALVNFRRTPDSAETCNSVQLFIGADSRDYCLKSIGGVFHREQVTLIGGSRATDIPDSAYAVTEAGYYSRLVGMFPFGFPDEYKTVREIQLDHDTKTEVKNLLTLRIGNSFTVQDPMSTDPLCAVQWHDQESEVLACPDTKTLAAMKADGQNPSDPTSFIVWETGRRLYFDFRTTAADGSPPKGTDSAWSALRFDVAVVDG